jgi:peptidoglycan/LPS O-acetylase OafA/YrhL
MKTARFAGLDALRFVAAFWVVVSHLGAPPFFAGADRSHWAMWTITGAYDNLFSGPAAVIVFFVISGFCIHYPYAAGVRFGIVPFYLRRFLRIGIPVAAAILISVPLGVELDFFGVSILWSLLAELVYYALYPALRVAWRHLGLDAILAASYVLALAVVLADPIAGNYASYGWKLNWLLGLPCWLLGVRLAEKWASRDAAPVPVGDAAIWSWRSGIWALSVACSLLRSQSPLGYPWTLNLFAIAVYFWIDREIARALLKPPAAALEWSGTFSYSIYLFHILAIAIYAKALAPGWPALLNWIVQLGFILAISYLFYVVVESGAHRLARKAGRHALERSRTLAR